LKKEYDSKFYFLVGGDGDVSLSSVEEMYNILIQDGYSA